MNTNLKATGLELTPAIRTYILDKLGQIERLLPPLAAVLAEVEVGRTTAHHHKGLVFRAEINLHLAGELFRAEKEAEDLYAAIDLAKDELSREIKSRKARKESLFRRGARAIKRLFRRT